MKKIITFLGCATAMLVSAQPSFQYANWPTGGQPLIMYVVTDPGSALAPTPGMDQIWDHSSVTFQQAGVASIGSAAGTPFAGSYPDANYVYTFTVTGQPTAYSYIVVNNTSVQQVATNVPLDINDYTDYKQILKFPLALGESFTDSYVSTNHSGPSTWTYAGHGTLITSLGTFPDQLLMIESETEEMVIWNPDPLYPRMVSNGSAVTFYVPGYVGTTENALSTDQFTVFPNPVISVINVVGVESDDSWRILDLQGRLLASGNWTSVPDRTINIEALAAGQYLFISDGERGSSARRFVK